MVETLGRVYLVTEWVRGGELYNHITQGGPLREIHAAPLFKQLLLAVKHMVSCDSTSRKERYISLYLQLVITAQLGLCASGY